MFVATPGFTEIGEQSAPSYLFFTKLSWQSQMKRPCWLYFLVENLLSRQALKVSDCLTLSKE